MIDDDDLERWMSPEHDHDGEPPPFDPAEASLDLITRMMGALRHRYRQVAEYSTLENAELARLRAQRDRVMGPVARKIKDMEGLILDYSVQSFLATGKIRVDTPNGIVKSRVVETDLSLENEELAGFLGDESEMVTFVPKIDKAAFRKWVRAEEKAERLVRVIEKRGPDGEIATITTLGAGEVYRKPFDPSEAGRFLVVGKEGDGPIPGASWSPNGTSSVGRNFSLDIS